MGMKTADLTGGALDWAVCQCLGEPYSPVTTYNGIGMDCPATLYSSDWSLAGPVVEREGISIVRVADAWGVDERGYCSSQRIPVWCATLGRHGTCTSTEYAQHDPMFQIYAENVVHGPTPLIAAMRCYVAAKLGNLVEIPADLVKDAAAA